MATQEFRITDTSSIGLAFSGGSVEGFMQSLGCALAWRDHGLQKPRRIAATSGGVFAAIAMVLDIEDQAREMVLDEAFQAEKIFAKVPWHDVPLKGFQEYVFGDTVEAYFGNARGLVEELCSRSDTTELIVVTTPLRRSAGSVRGTNARPFEEHFSSAECAPDVMFDAIWASAAMPSAYPYVLKGRPYTDGGFSRWYPLGVACRGVDIGIGFCYQIDIPKFSDSRTADRLERWLHVVARVPKIRDAIAQMRSRASSNLPATYFDVYERIIKMHIWRDMEIEETWATRQENQRIMLRQIAEETGQPEIVWAAMKEHAPHLAEIAPHRTIFTSASTGNVNINLRKNVPWTRSQKEAAIQHGYQKTHDALTKWLMP